MKVKINKKNLIFLGIFILLLILGSISILLSIYGIQNKLFLINKYLVLREYCQPSNQLLALQFDCNALIDKYEDIGNEKECFTLSVITKNYNFKEVKVCEKKGVVKLNENIVTERRIPVYLSFKYIGIPIFPYFFKEGTLTLMKDESISNLDKALIDNNHKDIDLYSKAIQDLYDNGYYISNDLEIVEGKNLKRVIFNNNKIQEIKTQGDTIILDIESQLFGQKHNIQLTSKLLLYTPNIFAKSTKVLSTNISEIDLTRQYQILFLYLPKGNNITNDDLLTYCNNPEKGLVGESVCEVIKDSNIEYTGIDIDRYIKEATNSTGDERITFNNLLFYSLLLTNDN